MSRASLVLQFGYRWRPRHRAAFPRVRDNNSNTGREANYGFGTSSRWRLNGRHSHVRTTSVRLGPVAVQNFEIALAAVPSATIFTCSQVFGNLALV